MAEAQIGGTVILRAASTGRPAYQPKNRMNVDYFIPDIALKGQKLIGHYGRLHRTFLAEHHPVQYNELVLFEKLNDHCAEVDEAARNRLNSIIPRLAEQYGVTERLKAKDPAQWVSTMNMIQHQAEEIVLTELVYSWP